MAAVMTYASIEPHIPSTHETSVEPMSSPWSYPQVSLPYNDPYMGTYVSAADEAAAFPTPNAQAEEPGLSYSAGSTSTWSSPHNRPSNIDTSYPYTPLPLPSSTLPSYLSLRPHSAHLDSNRPRSSPCSFGPTAESIHWPESSRIGLGIHGYGEEPVFTPALYGPPMSMSEQDAYASQSPPALQQPTPRRRYPVLAPSPGSSSVKRERERDDETPVSASPPGKRRKRAGSVAATDLSDDDKFLVRLKEEEALPWKDIAQRFGDHHNKVYQVAALQMRYKRLREKFRVWNNEDVEALKLAHEYWEKYKWDIIGSKMLHFGIQERWPSKQCARKWSKLYPSPITTMGDGMSSTMNSAYPYPSPAYIDSAHPNHFAFVSNNQ